MAPRTLVVEDNPTNLYLMRYLLEASGHTVFTASDGRECLDRAIHHLPDLIVCDVQIPEMGGLEVARWLKSHPLLREIPLIAVTALAMIGDREKVLAAGFDGYISKPINPESFVQQIDPFLRLKRAPTPAPVPSSREPARPPAAKVARILVVDNSPVNVYLARSIFEPHGYEVQSACGMGEALPLARRTRPDVILSDIHMLDGSGYDFIKAVKQDTDLRSIPFVFISSTSVDAEHQAMGLSLGAARFIIRPIEAQALLAEIAACLQQRQ
jgi:two-component system cell cycle response regulator